MVEGERPMSEKCKHCNLGIKGSPYAWLHVEGPQRGKVRCALTPYGYDAAPDGEECSHSCLGSLPQQ